MLGLDRKGWRKVADYTCLGFLLWLGIAVLLIFLLGMVSDHVSGVTGAPLWLTPLGWAVPMAKSHGWRPPSWPLFLSSQFGTCIFFLNAFALTMSGLFILRFGPPQGRLPRAPLMLLASIFALISGLFWGKACFDAIAAGKADSCNLRILLCQIYEFLHRWPGYSLLSKESGAGGYLAFIVTAALPLAWCLTWSIDVVRRQRASGAA